MASRRTRELWERAVPLDEAWYEFAEPGRRKDFDDSQGFAQEFAKTAEDAPNAGLWNAVNKGLTAWQTRDKIIREMREQLTIQLFNSNLIAVGFHLSSSRRYYPVRIEPNFFEYAKVNWQKSTARLENETYSNIRVFDPYAVIPELGGARRKGSVEAIDRAIADLRSSNPEFCNLPRKSACQLVREKLGRSEIPGNGLSNQNISKRIVANCGKRGIK